ncbi:MAG: 16S rRNA (uracil(1498)-N(3))-methyltransferase [Bacteroidales bacterium]|jgi:16S rRNA (uracil1498-N3)-methyltransferase|nr:16S rRNA (uracil(1498)-N(3))-methyltransferase [Bacteroidales bacterium]
MHLFLATIENNYATLNEAESQHCAKVLRLSIGDKILISDGQGKLCDAELTVVNHKVCEAAILGEIGVFKRPYYLHVACAPTKNIERFEWFLEKATEIGIDEITPIITEHSERTIVKRDRSERVIMAAMKQCQAPNLPTIHEIKKFSDFLENCHADQKFIGYCGDEFEKQTLKNALCNGTDYKSAPACVFTTGSDISTSLNVRSLSGVEANPSILILIGPEGDFSQKEVALAVENGFVPVTLGETRLRTETAVIVAVHTVSLTLQP